MNSMEAAIVIDTSREIPPKLYDVYDIYPVGYIVEDSKGKIYKERLNIRSLQTEKLLSILDKDKKSQLYSPPIKDFVELYTYLTEDYDMIISIHSSSITPAVFENAIIAKKLVSGAQIDIVDTPSFGSSSAIATEMLANKVIQADSINDVRKEGFSINKQLQSLVISKNDDLTKVGIRKSSWWSGFTMSLRPFLLYRLLHGQWNEIKKARSVDSLVNELKETIHLITQAKEIKNIYAGAFGEISKFSKIIEDNVGDCDVKNTQKSLVTHLLLGKTYLTIGFL